MVAVGTEGQPKEVGLTRILTETVIGKIGELISFQIQDCDGLMRLTLLRAISVVQRGGVAIVRTERDSGWKTIYRSHPAGRGRIQPLAGWKRNATRFSKIIHRKQTDSGKGEQESG